MKSKNYIKDIKMFINEAYSDNEPLQENQIKSKQVFNDYCNEIKKDLDRLEKLENLLEKYEIEDLSELEIALDQYYHRYDKVETRRVDNNE